MGLLSGTGLEQIPRAWWGKCAIAGLIGGAAMALYMMATLGAARGGWWVPINVIGAMFPAFWPAGVSPSVPLGFVPGQSLVGLAIHLVFSVVWALFYGALIAAFAPRQARSASWQTAMGLGWGVTIWSFFGLGLMWLFDPVVILYLAPSVHFFVANVIYAVLTAWVIAAWTQAPELSVTFAPEAPVNVGPDVEASSRR